MRKSWANKGFAKGASNRTYGTYGVYLSAGYSLNSFLGTRRWKIQFALTGTYNVACNVTWKSLLSIRDRYLSLSDKFYKFPKFLFTRKISKRYFHSRGCKASIHVSYFLKIISIRARKIFEGKHEMKIFSLLD